MDAEHIRARIVEYRAAREQALAQVNWCAGAIAALEDMLKPVVEMTPEQVDEAIGAAMAKGD